MTLALHAHEVLAALAPGARKNRDAAEASGADAAFADALAQQSDDAAPGAAASLTLSDASGSDTTIWRSLAAPAAGATSKTGAKADAPSPRFGAGALLARKMAAAQLGDLPQSATRAADGATPAEPATPNPPAKKPAAVQASGAQASGAQASNDAASDAPTRDVPPPLGALPRSATPKGDGATPADPAPQKSNIAASDAATRDASPPLGAWRDPAPRAAASATLGKPALQAASDKPTLDVSPLPSNDAATPDSAPARVARDAGAPDAAPVRSSARVVSASSPPRAGTQGESADPELVPSRSPPDLALGTSKAQIRAAAPATASAGPSWSRPTPPASTAKTATRGAPAPAAADSRKAPAEKSPDAAASASGDVQLAALLATAPAIPAPAIPTPSSQPPASAADADSVARIGAAIAGASVAGASLAGSGLPSSGSVRLGGASAPSAKIQGAAADLSLATDDKPKSFVHVLSQQTWLPPVAAGLSPSHSAPTPDHPLEQQKGSASEAAVAEAKAQPPLPLAAALSSADLAPSSPPLPTGAGASSRGTPATSAPSSAAASQVSEPAAPLLTTRRDLEITLEPQGLGGLQVRMKSAGDRLEIAFVADRGETARLISDKSGALKEQLHQAGLGLAGLDIATAARAATGDSAQSFSSSASMGGGAARDDAGAQPQPQRQSGLAGKGQEQSHDSGDKAQESQSAPGARGLYL